MFGRKERRSPLTRQQVEKLEDMRDDCIALYLNSEMTQRDIHAAGGPTPQTISRWLYKETHFPQLLTIQRFMNAVGYDLMPMPMAQAAELRARPIYERLQLDVALRGRPRMPARKKRNA